MSKISSAGRHCQARGSKSGVSSGSWVRLCYGSHSFRGFVSRSERGVAPRARSQAESEVVHVPDHMAVGGGAEYRLRHREPLLLDQRPLDTETGEHRCQGPRQLRSEVGDRRAMGSATGRRVFSLTQSKYSPTSRGSRFAYQLPSLVVGPDGAAEGLTPRRSRSRRVQRRVNKPIDHPNRGENEVVPWPRTSAEFGSIAFELKTISFTREMGSLNAGARRKRFRVRREPLPFVARGPGNLSR